MSVRLKKQLQEGLVPENTAELLSPEQRRPLVAVALLYTLEKLIQFFLPPSGVTGYCSRCAVHCPFI